MRDNPRAKKLTTTALMAAVIFVVTYLIRIPMPGVQGAGSLNLGDAAIYITSALLGGPAGMIAAAIGSGLADLLAGLPYYVLATMVIKGLMGFICGKIAENGSFRLYLTAAIIGGAIMVCGYALFDIAMLSISQDAVNYSLALATIWFNLVQWALGVAVAAAFFPAVYRIKKSLKL